MDPGLHPPVPILRMFDLEATRRFYLDFLGCALDWQEGGDGYPAFMQVSRGPLVLNLSSHHGDGTPGGVVLVFVDDVEALRAELHAKDYPFTNPASSRMERVARWCSSIRRRTRSGSSSAVAGSTTSRSHWHGGAECVNSVRSLLNKGS